MAKAMNSPKSDWWAKKKGRKKRPKRNKLLDAYQNLPPTQPSDTTATARDPEKSACH